MREMLIQGNDFDEISCVSLDRYEDQIQSLPESFTTVIEVPTVKKTIIPHIW